jgi:predicted PurR-regulated permease PerM
MKFKRIIVVMVVIAAILAVGIMFKGTIKRIFTIIIFASVLAYLALPLIKALEKRTNKSAASIIGITILASVGATFIVFLVPVFIKQIQGFFAFLPEYVSVISERFRLYVDNVPILRNLFNEISIDKAVFERAADFLNAISPSSIVTVISNLFLIPVVMYYILKEREQLKKICLYILPVKIRKMSVYVFRDINRQLRDYVIGEFIVILIVSGMMAFTLALFGFKYWLILGLIMGIFNVIPYIGPFLGSVPVVLTAASGGWNRILIAVTIIILVQQIDNFIIQPRVISVSVKIHPAIVLLCVVAGNSIGNFVGMVLAIPVYIVFRILFKEFYKYFSERNRKNYEIA